MCKIQHSPKKYSCKIFYNVTLCNIVLFQSHAHMDIKKSKQYNDKIFVIYRTNPNVRNSHVHPSLWHYQNYKIILFYSSTFYLKYHIENGIQEDFTIQCVTINYSYYSCLQQMFKFTQYEMYSGVIFVFWTIYLDGCLMSSLLVKFMSFTYNIHTKKYSRHSRTCTKKKICIYLSKHL